MTVGCDLDIIALRDGLNPFEHLGNPRHGNRDIFDDTPEVSRIFMMHLHFKGFRKHLVERARG